MATLKGTLTASGEKNTPYKGPKAEISFNVQVAREVKRLTKEIMHAMEVVVGIYGKRRKYRVPLPSGQQAKLIVTGVLSSDDCKVLELWVESLLPGLMASDVEGAKS